MNFYVKFFLLLGIISLASTFTITGDEEWKHQLKNLPFKDRLMVFLASQIKSKRAEELPQIKFQDLFDDYAYGAPAIDNFFVDARQLFTQSKNTNEDTQLPEIDWRETYEFCFWPVCFDGELRLVTRDSKFLGTNTIKSDTKITPTTIENTFKVNSFNWTSPGFLFNTTDYIRKTIWLDQNAFVSFENVTISFYCGYHFVPDVGIQIANLTIHFNPGKVRGWVSNITQWDFDGNLLATYEPVEFPYDEIMTEIWGFYKREYTTGLQYSINCLLSNGRLDPEHCLNPNQDDYGWPTDLNYFKLVNMQLLHTIGLGQLLQ